MTMSTSPTWLRCLSEVIKTHPKAKPPRTATPYRHRASCRLYTNLAMAPNVREAVYGRIFCCAGGFR